MNTHEKNTKLHLAEGKVGGENPPGGILYYKLQLSRLKAFVGETWRISMIKRESPPNSSPRGAPKPQKGGVHGGEQNHANKGTSKKQRYEQT